MQLELYTTSGQSKSDFSGQATRNFQIRTASGFNNHHIKARCFFNNFVNHGSGYRTFK